MLQPSEDDALDVSPDMESWPRSEDEWWPSASIRDQRMGYSDPNLEPSGATNRDYAVSAYHGGIVDLRGERRSLCLDSRRAAVKMLHPRPGRTAGTFS